MKKKPEPKPTIESKRQRLNLLLVERSIEKTTKNDHLIEALQKELDYFDFGV